MLVTKVVIRILDAENRLLGWTEVMAEARGDGCLWPPTNEVRVIADEAGTLARQSIHWVDVNVEASVSLPSQMLRVGDSVTITYRGGPMMTIGPAAGGLPPVTVRSPVSVNVPIGALGARTH